LRDKENDFEPRGAPHWRDLPCHDKVGGGNAQEAAVRRSACERATSTLCRLSGSALSTSGKHEKADLAEGVGCAKNCRYWKGTAKEFFVGISYEGQGLCRPCGRLCGLCRRGLGRRSATASIVLNPRMSRAGSAVCVSNADATAVPPCDLRTSALPRPSSQNSPTPTLRLGQTVVVPSTTGIPQRI
jgi:hypothetical protein